MSNTVVERPQPVVPTEAEMKLAKVSGPALARLLKSPRQRVSVQVDSQTISLPVSAFRLLSDILNEMAQGNTVTLIPIHAELTTQQAADLLNVSRPFLVGLIEAGTIPARKVGTHRRVLSRDVLRYKQKTDANRLKALEELSALDQELGLGY